MSAVLKIQQLQEYPQFTDQQVNLLKNTICKGASNDEFNLFCYVCKKTGLDPFVKQIYAVHRKTKNKDGSYTSNMVIQTGIDGLRLIADRSGDYAPGKEPTYVYDKDGNIVSATACIKKRTSDGQWHEVSATAFWREYKPAYGHFWDNMPHLMLAKCAEALALRKAFPAELSGLYTTEEMAQAEKEEKILEVKNEISSEDTLEKFLTQFKEEERPIAKEYIERCEKNWKSKTLQEILGYYSNLEIFHTDLSKWKAKQISVRS